MSLFDPIEITWKEEKRTVEPEKVMRVLAKLEDEITFMEANQLVAEAVNSGSRKQIKVSMAYANFLQSCGFKKVTASEVIETLDYSAYIAALVEIIGVLKLTLAPDERDRYESLVNGDIEPEVSGDSKKKQTAAKRSPRKRTKQS